MKRRDSLPPNLAPRGLSRIEAAAYIGIGTSKFDELVADGRMPRPKIIDKRKTWDRYALDAAYADLPNEGRRHERMGGFSICRDWQWQS